jgi:6-phosphofructokinase 1
MSDAKAVAILTSGGDCGGLNAVLKGAASMALTMGIKLYAIPNGYAGLYNLKSSGNLVTLDWNAADAIVSLLAGSDAGNTRVKISGIEDPQKYQVIRDGLAKHNIGGLIIAGGDDTGSVVVDLCNQGINCVHVPKTMDLDLHTYSVGGDSSVNRIARFIEDVKTTGRSHNRVMIVEVFGRYAGHTTLLGGLAGDADCILIPEIPVDFDVVYSHLRERFQRRISSSAYKNGTYIIAVSEGFTDATQQRMSDQTLGADAFGHKKLGGTGKHVRQQLSDRMKADPSMIDFMKQQGLFVEQMNALPEIREVLPSYLFRSGPASAMDACFGKNVGAAALAAIVNGMSGVTITGVIGGVVQFADTAQIIRQRMVQEQTVAFYEGMGICFGRNSSFQKPQFARIEKTNWNYL